MLKFISNKLYSLAGYSNYYYGEAYQKGTGGFSKDPHKAIVFYKKAISDCDIRAYLRLAEISKELGRLGDEHFYKGLDYEARLMKRLAIKEYRQAVVVDSKHADSWYRLALIFDNSEDPLTDIEGFPYLNCYFEAAKLGHKQALQYLLNHYQNNSDIAYELGRLYALGLLPVAVDSPQERFNLALPYYIAAARLENGAALSLTSKSVRCS